MGGHRKRIGRGLVGASRDRGSSPNVRDGENEDRAALRRPPAESSVLREGRRVRASPTGTDGGRTAA